MAEAITDRQVVAALRPFVRATAPMLDALRDSDPLGLLRRALPEGDPAAAEGLSRADRSLLVRLRRGLDHARVPGTPAWVAMGLDDRVDWWVNRVGRLTVLLAAIPGVGGALADRLPIQDTLAVAGQGLLLSAIAAEHGRDQPDRVRLIAKVLFDRDVDRATAEGERAAAAAEDAATVELTRDLTESSTRHGRVTVKAAARTLWRFGRTLWALGDELDKRPQGRFYHQALGMLPLVGAAGDYLGERSALKRAARKADRWLAADPATQRTGKG